MASACGMVRGKPSNRKPLAQSGWARRSFTRLMIRSSLTSAPDVHDGLGLQAERRAGLDGRAQHVAGGDLRDAVLLADEGGLRAFARAGRAQQNQSHGCPRKFLESRARAGQHSARAPRAQHCRCEDSMRPPSRDRRVTRRVQALRRGRAPGPGPRACPRPGPGASSVTCTAMRWPCHSARSCSSASTTSTGAWRQRRKPPQETGAVAVDADVAQRRAACGQRPRLPSRERRRATRGSARG